MDELVDIIPVAERTVVAHRFHVAMSDLDRISSSIGTAFATVVSHLARAGAAPVGPAVARYEPTGDGFDVAAGFAVDATVEPDGEIERIVVGGCEAAHLVHIGPYADLPAAYDVLHTEVEARGRRLDDEAPMWEEYWTGPDTPSAQTRTDVYWPVRSGRR